MSLPKYGYIPFVVKPNTSINKSIGFKNILKILSKILYFPNRLIGFFTCLFSLFLTLLPSQPII